MISNKHKEKGTETFLNTPLTDYYQLELCFSVWIMFVEVCIKCISTVVKNDYGENNSKKERERKKKPVYTQTA